jgi:hypothetical protein
MRKKKPIPFSQKFPNADPLALRLLERMLAFEPKDRPTAEEVNFDTFSWPFGSVAAGEVHPQPHVISFGKGKKLFFTGRTHYKLK